MKQHRRIYILSLLLLMGVVMFLAYFFGDSLGIFGDKVELENFIRSFGVLAAFVLVFFISVEVVIAPLPGGFLPLAAGAIFGPLIGTLLSWVANLIGSSVAFFIARRYGEGVIRFFIPSFQKEIYDDEMRTYKKFFWMSYAIPLIPVDVLSFAIGTSSIKFRTFIKAIAFPFLIRMGLWNFFGDALVQIFFA